MTNYSLFGIENKSCNNTKGVVLQELTVCAKQFFAWSYWHLCSYLNGNGKSLLVCLTVIHTSQEPFIRSTSHLVGVVLSTRKSAVLNVVQFGHTTYPILIWNKQPTWLYATAGSSFIALTPRLGKYWCNHLDSKSHVWSIIAIIGLAVTSLGHCKRPKTGPVNLSELLKM